MSLGVYLALPALFYCRFLCEMLISNRLFPLILASVEDIALTIKHLCKLRAVLRGARRVIKVLVHKWLCSTWKCLWDIVGGISGADISSCWTRSVWYRRRIDKMIGRGSDLVTLMWVWCIVLHWQKIPWRYDRDLFSAFSFRYFKV